MKTRKRNKQQDHDIKLAWHSPCQEIWPWQATLLIVLMAITVLFDFVLCLLGLGDAKALSQQLLAAFYGACGALFALIAGRKSTATAAPLFARNPHGGGMHSHKTKWHRRHKKAKGEKC